MSSHVPTLALALLTLAGLRGAESPSGVSTPATLPGAKTFVYRELQPEPVRLHLYLPEGWRAEDRRPGFVWFFGGGWLRGIPTQSASWARRAAETGMIGVAVDYRTRERFGTNGTAAVADARLALRWLQEHAGELGLDPARVVVGGSSAGGHLALWTAITTSPPDLPEKEAPRLQPAALLLISAPVDTSVASGYGAERFGPNPDAYSPLQHMDASMPPALIIHGDADPTVPYRYAVALRDALVERGGVVEFVTVPGGTHRFSSELPEWGAKVRQLQLNFLTNLKLLPVNEP